MRTACRPLRPARAQRAPGQDAPWEQLGRDRCDTGLGACPARLEIPLDGPPHSLLEIGDGLEIELARGARDVQGAARLTVGLAWIPHDVALKSGHARD